MKKMLMALLFVVYGFASAHCPVSFTEVGLCTDLKWPKGAYYDQKNVLDFFFWKNGDKNHVHVTPDYDLKVYSWMVMDSGMEHGGPKFNLVQVSEGTYEVDNAFFMGGMVGYWSVVMELKDKVTGAVVSKASTKVSLLSSGDVAAPAVEHNHAH